MTESPLAARFDPTTATREDWSALHAFRRRRHAESSPEEPFKADDLAELSLRREEPDFISEALWTLAGDLVVGFTDLWGPRPGSAGYQSQKGILEFNTYVLKEHRGRGAARAMLPLILDFSRRNAGRVLGTGTHEEGGLAVLDHYGFVKKSEARYSRLDLAALDWGQVERWAAEGRDRNPDRDLRFYLDGPPEEEWPEYCAAMTELFNTIPWDDVEHGDFIFTPETVGEQVAHFAASGSKMLRILVREGDGRLSALTEMVVNARQEEHAQQWLTAVHKSAQGNGIGRWIKSAMLLELRRRFPTVRWVLTDNASSNRHMLKINIELGFKTYKVSSHFQVAASTLEAKVARRVPETS